MRKPALFTEGMGADMESGSRVTINHDTVLVIDGTKVFPIGFTMPPPPDGKAPNGRNGIEELRRAGATFLRTGVMARPWDEEAIGQEQRWLDAAARYGMYCLVNLRETAVLGPDDSEKEAMLRRIVDRFKGHPALGVWKHVDEPEWGKQPVPAMLRATRILRELDPHHPIEVTQAPRGTVETLRPYNVTTDIVAADIYPVGYPPGAHSLGPNKEISMVGDYTQTMRQVAAGGRPSGQAMPVWMTLQIAWSGVIKPGKTLRFPTFPQERFMTYQAIINGARGLIFFGGHIERAMAAEDARLGWNWRFWDRVLRPVVEEIGDKSPLYPALVAPDSPRDRGVGRGRRRVLRARGGKRSFPAGLQARGATVNVTFRGLPPWAGHGDVLFEARARWRPRTARSPTGSGRSRCTYRFRRG